MSTTNDYHIWSVSRIFFCKYVRGGKYNYEEENVHIIEINLCTSKDINNKDCIPKNPNS